MQQAQAFIQFCDHYHLCFINPDFSTMCLFITHLIRCFSSARSIRNYVFGVRALHKEMEITPASLESFQVSRMLQAADISMRTPTFPSYCHSYCSITSSLVSLFCLVGVSHLWVLHHAQAV